MTVLPAADAPIPIFTTLKDLYGSLATAVKHAERWDELVREFHTKFGRKPTYVARAPGRVNLIGEHIDYAHFGVFPAAIEHDILIACAPRPASTATAHPDRHAPGSVVAENLHTRYTRQVFMPTRRHTLGDDVPLDAVRVAPWHLDIDKSELRWESYVKAGYYGVLNHFFSSSCTSPVPVPVDILITGTVPPGSGLSSSAAMVVSSTLAFLAANGIFDGEKAPTKGELINIAVENERRVGVNSGGMDQSASVIALPGSALYVSFVPSLHAEPIVLPRDAVFVCANSLVVSNKAESAKHQYNLRVVETLGAARVLAHHLNLQVDSRDGENTKRRLVTLREVLARKSGFYRDEQDVQQEDLVQLRKGLEDLLEGNVLDCLLPKIEGRTGVTLEEMIGMGGMDEAEFREVYLSWVDVETTYFELYLRAKHVFEEALRVLQFREVCLDGGDNEESKLQTLGKYMNASHASCNDQFDCSHPKVNDLVQVARSFGEVEVGQRKGRVYGSRVTGAGWGGCTVSLVHREDVEAFIAHVKKKYPSYEGMSEEDLAGWVFATEPGMGACVFKFTD
ncbi:ribosomal protein S5 domain 2-type protein [Suillus clintonianus]|uniref:ribosomal protein S5 domain 2-type protein n=1 Tax=Suillus clintonianus TaxID=1904413 RepID=UPI001B87AECE|nr:ribosomal protein S5 domain 2-type protein [Suillus clintonianus]KAG2154000.1 ribosomal protein S5 domain 2-type protein [Suillus clintonianus]